jgi:hypothetical protein
LIVSQAAWALSLTASVRTSSGGTRGAAR